MKTIYVFAHNDLDGVGVQIIGRKYAESQECPCEIFKCNYSEVNHEVENLLKREYKRHYAGIQEILIGDISVNSHVAELLNRAYKSGVPVILRDHHATAEWLNMYEWAMVAEKDPMGVPYCGTFLLAKEFPEVFKEFDVFIRTVDSWDTWKWKAEGNINAKRLNALYKIMGVNQFTQYIFNLDHSKIEDSNGLFTDYAKALVYAHEMLVNKTAASCEEHLWVSSMGFKVSNKVYRKQFKVGIAFCNNDISEVADYILDRHPELDFVMIGNLPNAFSFRTQKQLAIPLGEIAKQITGSGGGHPHAAGAIIQEEDFQKGLFKLLKSCSKGCAVYDLEPKDFSDFPDLAESKSAKGKQKSNRG